MNRTYMTTMEDKSGAFLLAGRIILRYGGNITRVNYNRAVDAHMLFVDVEASEAAHELIRCDLAAGGFLEGSSDTRIVLVEFELEDRPGTVLPILETLNSYQINIAYISSQENGTGKQFFKMGLVIEEPAVINTLLKRLSTLCPVRILQYDEGEKTLDNTVFYITFASRIRQLLNLSQEKTNEFIANANLIMQQLDDVNEPPRKTFEYISHFARFVAEHDVNSDSCRITHHTLTNRVKLTVIEPPCGSNINILEDANGDLLMVDSGFECYRASTLRLIRDLIPDFDARRKQLLLTHADKDHVGLAAEFDVIHLSQRSYNSFANEVAGQPNYRERNRKTLPYCRLSKIITGYHPPKLDQLHVIDSLPCDDSQPLSLIGHFCFADLRFDVWQGNGGHLPGEIVLIDEASQVALTGDDYVNVHAYTPDQAAFNRLAPYLMTSVNEDSVKAKAILKELFRRLNGQGYIVIPGHGAVIARGETM